MSWASRPCSTQGTTALQWRRWKCHWWLQKDVHSSEWQASHRTSMSSQHHWGGLSKPGCHSWAAGVYFSCHYWYYLCFLEKINNLTLWHSKVWYFSQVLNSFIIYCCCLLFVKSWLCAHHFNEFWLLSPLSLSEIWQSGKQVFLLVRIKRCCEAKMKGLLSPTISF